MDDSERFVADAIDRLAAAVDDRGSPFRNLALATVSPDGVPEARTVVLREVRRDPLSLVLFTDARAGKIADLERNGRVAVLAWSDPDKLQLRIAGHAVVHGPGSAEARRYWDALPPHGRDSYGLDRTPGTPVERADATRPMEDPDRERCFAAVRVTAEHLDVLRLGPHGKQTRATRNRDGAASWVAP